MRVEQGQQYTQLAISHTAIFVAVVLEAAEGPRLTWITPTGTGLNPSQ